MEDVKEMIATAVRGGSWQSNAAYASVSDGFIPFDVQVMNWYDRLVPTRNVDICFWKMKATSNGSFYIFPEQKEGPVSMRSPNDYNCELTLEGSGIVATLFALGHQGTPEASKVYQRLLKFAMSLDEYKHMHRLLD
jgi:hypothetical protein